MAKTILITGSTDGIGLEAAKKLIAQGHHVLLHGRSATKLADVQAQLGGAIGGYTADLSDMAEVAALAKAVIADHDRLDVLVNNAGVLKAADPVLPTGHDLRFMVNTFAPVLLTRLLAPLFGPNARVVNLSSAAQAPVDLKLLAGQARARGDMDAYAQSKLALTMWSRVTGEANGAGGPVMVAVNPGSLLATNMVRQGFGMAGNDIGIGADILCRAALSDEFAGATGRYFDNDAGRFSDPHRDALDAGKSAAVVAAIDDALAALTG